jgi:zinc finger protein 830
MADARSMLRNARASRRINHPQATYSTTGNVVCLICHIQLKAESLWESHLRSSQHAMRLQRIWDGALGRPPGAPPPNDGKKRKADEGDGNSYDIAERKKIKSGDLSTSQSTPSEADLSEEKSTNGGLEDRERAQQDERDESYKDGALAGNVDESASRRIFQAAFPPNSLDSTRVLPSNLSDQNNISEGAQSRDSLGIDEDEWAAFERDVATPPAEDKNQAINAINTSATISAPAMSAAEIAARSAEETNLQRKDQREAELEGEREDAARQLEDEFDAMETYEARVKRLKERREQIRSKVNTSAVKKPPAIHEPGSSDDEASSGGDYDDWAFKTTK